MCFKSPYCWLMLELQFEKFCYALEVFLLYIFFCLNYAKHWIYVGLQRELQKTEFKKTTQFKKLRTLDSFNNL